MALPANAFVTVTDLKGYLNMTGAGQEMQLENAIGVASSLIESVLEREIPTRGDLTEFHSPRMPATEVLYLGEFPIIAVSSVHEDASRQYGSAALLVADQDFIASKPMGKLIRAVSGSGYYGIWWPGFRTIRVIYSAGYQNADGTPDTAQPIPADLRLICFELAALLYQEADRKRWGISAVSDTMGNVTRYMGYLTPDISARLCLHKRIEFSRTWERDA
jgi:hypothetical protein